MVTLQLAMSTEPIKPHDAVQISGFDRFAGVEGLRGCCLTRSITSDKYPGIRTNIPPALQYPVKVDMGA